VAHIQPTVREDGLSLAFQVSLIGEDRPVDAEVAMRSFYDEVFEAILIRHADLSLTIRLSSGSG
jgi:hypothetical protein